MPTAAIIGIVIVVLLAIWAVFGGSRRDKPGAQARTNAAAFQNRAAADPDWGLTETARQLGLTLDLPGDRVTANGQATGRFTGSRISMDALADLGRNRTPRNLTLLGAVGALIPDADDRETYLTVLGDGFQLAVRVQAPLGEQARQFTAAYNTRSGVLASQGSATDVMAGQLAQLGRMARASRPMRSS